MSAYPDGYVTINADSTASRRSRAAQINAEKRRHEAVHNVSPTLISKSYSETPGFLSRSSFRYQVTAGRPERPGTPHERKARQP